MLARLRIAWDGTNYIDESAYLAQANGEQRLTAPGEGISSGRGQVDRCQIELWNQSARFSPFNSSSPIYALLQDGKGYHAPFTLDVSIDGGSTYPRIFTGVLKIPSAASVAQGSAGRATFDGRSRDELLIGKRLSTSLAQLNTYHDNGYTEAQIIDAWLTAAGVTSKSIMPGLVQIPWAWLDDESVLEECWNLAAAAGGAVYCDADGVMHYDNAVAWLNQSVQETIDRSAIGGLQISYEDKELYNSVTVEASTRYEDATGVIWEPDELVRVAPGQTKTITARYKQAAATATVTYKARTAAGADITGSVSVSAQTYAQRAVLTITNSHATAEAYLTPFSIAGNALVGGPTQEETKTSAADGYNSSFFTVRGDRSLSIRGNAYVQTRAQAAMLALMRLHRVERPRVTYTLQRCPGKPTRRVGWKINVTDANLLSATRTAYITSIRWRIGQTFTQDIEAVDASQMFVDGSYFVIGTNTLGAASQPIYY